MGDGRGWVMLLKLGGIPEVGCLVRLGGIGEVGWNW